VEGAAEEERAAKQALDLATVHYEGLQRDVDAAQERISALATAAYKSSGMYTMSAMLTPGARRIWSASSAWSAG
jgi:hypothetical protein